LSGMTILDSRRIIHEAGLLFGSYVENVFYNWLLNPLLHITTLLAITNFIINRKIRLSFIVALLNVLLFGLIGNGRLIYFYVGLYFLIAMCFRFMFNKKEIKKVRLKKWEIKKSTVKRVTVSIIFSLTVIYVMNLITVKRLGITNA